MEHKIASTLGKDLLRLYQEKRNCDFAVKSEDGKTIEVHQLILCARSTVLETMISTNMKEKETKTIHFKVSDDFTSSIVRED